MRGNRLSHAYASLRDSEQATGLQEVSAKADAMMRA